MNRFIDIWRQSQELHQFNEKCAATWNHWANSEKEILVCYVSKKNILRMCHCVISITFEFLVHFYLHHQEQFASLESSDSNSRRCVTSIVFLMIWYDIIVAQLESNNASKLWLVCVKTRFLQSIRIFARHLILWLATEFCIMRSINKTYFFWNYFQSSHFY